MLTPLPSWFRQDVPDHKALGRMRALVREGGLHTVCESARCPNQGECWGRGTATFMILGDVCTRACRFCAVAHGAPVEPDLAEPQKVADAVKALGLQYVVITSVTRDDLEDEGAGQFVRVIEAIRKDIPECRVEVLIPDMHARLELLNRIAVARPDVIGHNIETAQRISAELRPQASYSRSLKALAALGEVSLSSRVKSGLMVGLGETDDEVLETLKDLRATGCDMVTIGQYLAPFKSRRHIPVRRFVLPAVFDRYRREALEMGFSAVVAGPLVRSSYLAEQGYKDAYDTKSA
ncbi:MAG: lipoyl synthase [Candidatus Omnitrophica bacterium]|nr:lipoyl synthase [Candidatus Omnitrophota bacterium]